MKTRYLKYVLRPDLAVQILVGRLLEKLSSRWPGIPFSRWLVNFLFQRVFRLNSAVPFQVNFTSIIVIGNGIVVGRNVWKSLALSGNCYIQGGNGVNIGDDTILAPGIKIISANHDPEDLTAWLKTSPIRIGSRCWIGANAVILPGVEIGDDCIIGAGAVVTKSIPSGSVAAGNPARVIRSSRSLNR